RRGHPGPPRGAKSHGAQLLASGAAIALSGGCSGREEGHRRAEQRAMDPYPGTTEGATRRNRTGDAAEATGPASTPRAAVPILGSEEALAADGMVTTHRVMPWDAAEDEQEP